MKKSTLIFSCLLFTAILFAQEAEVPEYYSLEKPEDYTKYEEAVVSSINWILDTPLGIKDHKRNAANKFVLEWVMGSPNVSIEIKEEIVNFMDNSPNLLIIFIGGWTKYALESEKPNKIDGNKAGLDAVLGFYTKNKALLKKDKALEKYLKMKNKGTLNAYIEKNA